jgi:hypothetical protein
MAASEADARVKAASLLGRWTRLAQGHVPLGAGCSCGAGAASLRVTDYERDLLEYFAREHPQARAASSIAELLRALARGPQTGADSLLAGLERSLDSFEELHR